MHLIYKTIVLAAALALSGCASASMAGSHQHGMSAGPMASGQAGHHRMMNMSPLVGCHGAHGDSEARLAGMRTALNITSGQEATWSAYAAAFRAHAARMGEGMMAMGAGEEAAAPPSVAERLRHHESMLSQHLASIQALRAAIEPLYAAFSAEQRAAADALRCEGAS
jgi:hypothetical protein